MTPFRKWVSSNLPKKTNNPNQVFPQGRIGSDYIGLVPLTGLEPVLWKPERDFKSPVSSDHIPSRAADFEGERPTGSQRN